MNYTTKNYNQITKEERFFIQNSIQNNFSLRSIARSLKRNVSSISREIRKNCDYYGNYNFLIAEEKSWEENHINIFLDSMLILNLKNLVIILRKNMIKISWC